MFFDYKSTDPAVRCRVDASRYDRAKMVIDFPKDPRYFQLVAKALSHLIQLDNQFLDFIDENIDSPAAGVQSIA